MDPIQPSTQPPQLVQPIQPQAPVEQPPVSHRQVPVYVFTAVIVGVLALFLGTMYFMYSNTQRAADAARQRTTLENTMYQRYMPTVSVTEPPSAEEQAVDNIVITDPSVDLSILDQEAAKL